MYLHPSSTDLTPQSNLQLQPKLLRKRSVCQKLNNFSPPRLAETSNEYQNLIDQSEMASPCPFDDESVLILDDTQSGSARPLVQFENVHLKPNQASTSLSDIRDLKIQDSIQVDGINAESPQSSHSILSNQKMKYLLAGLGATTFISTVWYLKKNQRPIIQKRIFIPGTESLAIGIGSKALNFLTSQATSIGGALVVGVAAYKLNNLIHANCRQKEKDFLKRAERLEVQVEKNAHQANENFKKLELYTKNKLKILHAFGKQNEKRLNNHAQTYNATTTLHHRVHKECLDGLIALENLVLNNPVFTPTNANQKTKNLLQELHKEIKEAQEAVGQKAPTLPDEENFDLERVMAAESKLSTIAEKVDGRDGCCGCS